MAELLAPRLRISVSLDRRARADPAWSSQPTPVSGWTKLSDVYVNFRSQIFEAPISGVVLDAAGNILPVAS